MSCHLIQDYGNVFNEWLKKGIIEEVPYSLWDAGHYLPHRPVIKLEDTTKIRPVFEASARLQGHPSLNHCLEKGVNLIELMPDILLRMRRGKIGVIADIKKAFLQISLAEEDRDYLRFLWRDNNDFLRIFRHRRVVFGVSSSPFLLGAVIQHLLNRCQVENFYSLDNIKKLEESFYVDNCVTSVTTERELNRFIREATLLFGQAKFELRGWEYSDISLETSTETNVLGLFWNRKNDTLKIKTPVIERLDFNRITRRTILSITQQIFDIVGFCSPTTIIPKLLIQETWISGQEWDTAVEEDVRSRFENWESEIHLLEEIKIPRYIEMDLVDAKRSLHTFCDASKSAYAAGCFLRVEYKEIVNIYLIEAKSRVAPLKKITIPRLELLAATIGARLTSGIWKELGEIPVFYWSDSSTVLAWIKREEPWGGFWERLIGVLKKLLRRILGKASLNQEELCTILCDAESYINARPITYMSEDNADPIPITPKMFLQEIEEDGVADLDMIDALSIKKRVRYMHKLKEELKRRFRAEYLGQLLMSNQNEKEVKELKVGDLVLIGCDDQKRINWPLAVVKEVIPGRDQQVRSVRVRTAEGVLHRPVQRLYLLEIPSHCSGVEDCPNEREKTKQKKMEEKKTEEKKTEGEKTEDLELKTRCGRIITVPARYL